MKEVNMRNVVIVAGCRTPIGAIGGQFKTITSLDLSIPVMQNLVERAGIDPALIEDVIWGCNYQRTYKEKQYCQGGGGKSWLTGKCSGHHHSPQLYFFHVVHPVRLLSDQSGRSGLPDGRRRGQHEYSAAHGIQCPLWTEIRPHGAPRLHVGLP